MLQFISAALLVINTSGADVLKKGEIALKNGLYDSAEIYYSEAEHLFDTHNDKENLIFTKTRRSILYVSQNEYKKALTINNEAISLYKLNRLQNEALYSKLLANEAIIYDYSGIVDSALYLHEKALKIRSQLYKGPHLDLTASYNAIADIYRFHFFDYHTAGAYYQKALDILLALEEKDKKMLAKVYYNLSSVNRLKGDFSLAETYAFLALNLYKNNYGTDYESIANTLSLIANIYFENKNYTKALEVYRECLSVIDLCPSCLTRKSSYYNSMSSIFLELGKADSALQYSLNALKMKPANPSKVMLIHLNLGLAHNELRQFKKAQNNLTTALQMAIDYYGETSSPVALCYLNIGNNFAGQNLYKAALHAYRNALKSLGVIDNNKVKINFKKDNDFPMLIKVLKEIAEVHYLLYKHYNKHEFLINSFKYYNLVHEVLRRNSANLSMERSLLTWAREQKNGYEKAIQTAFELYHLSPSDSLISKSLEFFEVNKSFLLSQALKEAEDKKTLNVPDSILNKERAINAQILYYSKLSENETSRSARTDSIVSNFLIEKKNIQTLIRTNYTKYHDASTGKIEVNLQKIKERCNNEQVSLINFFQGKEFFYVIQIDGQNSRFHRIKNDEDFNRNFEKFQLSMNEDILHDPKQNFLNFTISSHFLYNNLIQPLNIFTKKVTIIPDGDLFLIPFEALLKTKNTFSTINFKDLDYLLKHAEISYAINLLELNKNKPGEVESPKVYGFSYGESSDSGFSSISKTNHEVKLLAHFRNNHIFSEGESTEGNFKKVFPHADIIHLASHGMYDESNTGTKLIFRKVKNADAEDGVLNLFDLYGLSSNCSLVIVNSCESGQGVNNSGEGIYNLARGFFYAGCKSVIVSLYKLNDAQNYKLYEHFYGHLKKSICISKAVNLAKIDYLKNSDEILSHPKFWAASIVYGNDQLSYSEPGFKKIYYIFGSLFLIVTILALRNTIRKS